MGLLFCLVHCSSPESDLGQNAAGMAGTSAISGAGGSTVAGAAGGSSTSVGGGASSGGANGTAGIGGVTASAGSSGTLGASGNGGVAGAGGTPIGSGGAGTGSLGGTAGSGGELTAGTSSAGGAAGSAGVGMAGEGGTGEAGISGAAGAPNLAMVVRQAGTPTAGDEVMLDVMRTHGSEPTIFPDATVQLSDVAMMDLVVISSSAESSRLQQRLRTLAVPILCIEDGQYRNQGMATASGKFDTNTIEILPGNAELVGALDGTVTIGAMSASEAGGWGTPAASALRGATVPGSADRVVVFGYPSGAQMVDLIAPAKRAGFAIREPIAANLTDDGKELFDSLLTWLLRP